MSQIEFDIEWTDRALAAVTALYKGGAGGGKPQARGKPSGAGAEPPAIGLPPLECCPAEGDVMFLGPKGNQQPFIVMERQYHHEGGDDWTIVLILDTAEDA
ncbi:hypothetical protein SAMN05216551_103175 [Chitinasiproducens palmae]|uniref:DNA-binding protein n=1 Tax=Chitinasiproducens palmae TaxID=1770053 RepID=A0A1H2PN95_9BURK|nr:hypothetical protein [Chitinasiproducens palmae]SDV47637.1 hypothetical protein SAMN05216551_103175 [Chitinasiproducens palmae]